MRPQVAGKGTLLFLNVKSKSLSQACGLGLLLLQDAYLTMQRCVVFVYLAEHVFNLCKDVLYLFMGNICLTV